MSLTVDKYNLKGLKEGSYDLPESIFGVKVSPVLLTQAIRVYLSNQRQVTRKIKTRGEVSYTTAKLYRQKGTGKARHGSRKAPIFVGGGKAHGPTGEENFKLTLSKTMRRQALLGSLSAKAEAKSITILEDISKIEAKTKILQDLLAKVVKYPESGKTLVILDESHLSFVKAAKNLPKVTSTQAHRLNTYEILNHDTIILTPQAIIKLAQILKIELPVNKSTKTAKVKSKEA